MPKEDRKELNIQKFRVQNNQHEIPMQIEEDPQVVIREARTQLKTPEIVQAQAMAPQP